MDGPKFPKRAEPGAVIGGCELVRRIGRGGMAEVWAARRAIGAKGSKSVAIKLIADHYVGDERYARMFRAEAELAAVLTHANIVQVFAEGEDEGRSYLEMEWVDGLNLLKLGDMLALLDDEQRRFRVISYIIGQLLHALNYAHSITSANGYAMGVVHRDVSPQNVLVSNHGEVKLTDFGVAHHNFEESSGIHVKGKVRYMAPEQLAGQTRSPTVDLYAVGALLHELLDGKKFRGEFEDGQDLFSVVLQGQLAPLSRPAPPELDHLRLGLLQPDPMARIQTAEEAFAVLKRYPGYGDARDELTKLCGSLTGVVKPRAGLNQSSQVPAADQRTTKWNSPKGLAPPKVDPSVGPRPAPSPSAPRRTGSTTAIKGVAVPSSSPRAQITGHTEFVVPRTGAGSRAPAAAPTVPLRLASLGTAPEPEPSVTPTTGVPAYASPLGSSPIPLHVHGAPSTPLEIQPSGAVRVEPSNPSIHPAPTERLVPSEISGSGSASAAGLGAGMMMGGAGSGTDQLPLQRRRDEGSDTGVAPRHLPTHSHPISVAPKKSPTVALIGLGLVLVAMSSISITWLLITRGRHDPESAAASGAGVTAGMATKPIPVEPQPSAAPKQVDPTEEPTPKRELVIEPETPSEEGLEAGNDHGVPPPNAATRDATVENEATRGSGTADEPAADPRDTKSLESSPTPAELEVKKKVVPKITVKVFGDPMLPKPQVKIGKYVLALNDDARVAVGKQTILWRTKAGEAWRSAGSRVFTAGKDVYIYITKDGPKIR